MLSGFFSRASGKKKKNAEKIFWQSRLENQKISGMIKTKQKIHQVVWNATGWKNYDLMERCGTLCKQPHRKMTGGKYNGTWSIEKRHGSAMAKAKDKVTRMQSLPRFPQWRRWQSTKAAVTISVANWLTVLSLKELKSVKEQIDTCPESRQDLKRWISTQDMMWLRNTLQSWWTLLRSRLTLQRKHADLDRLRKQRTDHEDYYARAEGQGWRQGDQSS